MRNGHVPRWDDRINDMLTMMLRREREAEVTKMEYLVMANVIITGLDAKVADKKLKVLMDLKNTMSEKVHFDAYDVYYAQFKKMVNKVKADREKSVLDKVAALGKG